MRTLRFAKVAAEAEQLRLTYMLRRYAARVVFAVLALIFLVSLLATAHVAGWLALLQVMQPLYAALVLVGVDFVMALLFGLIAARGSPSAGEREAKVLRDTAVAQITRPGLLTGPVVGLLIDRVFRLLAGRLFGGRGK